MTNPNTCPHYIKCRVNVCPLDAHWRVRKHIPGEPICRFVRRLDPAKAPEGITADTVAAIRAKWKSIDSAARRTHYLSKGSDHPATQPGPDPDHAAQQCAPGPAELEATP